MQKEMSWENCEVSKTGSKDIRFNIFSAIWMTLRQLCHTKANYEYTNKQDDALLRLVSFSQTYNSIKSFKWDSEGGGGGGGGCDDDDGVTERNNKTHHPD